MGLFYQKGKKSICSISNFYLMDYRSPNTFCRCKKTFKNVSTKLDTYLMNILSTSTRVSGTMSKMYGK